MQDRKVALRTGEVFNLQSLLSQLRAQRVMRHHSTKVLKVIADFRCCASLAANREEQLAVLLGLDNVVERIVLKDHRWRLSPKKTFAQLPVLKAETSQFYSERRFHTDINFEV